MVITGTMAPATQWERAQLLKGTSDDANTNSALASFNTLLAWMTACGRARLIFWDDHLDVEKCWIELKFPATDGQWATWEAGLDWEDQLPSQIDKYVDISRPSHSMNLDVSGESNWPSAGEGWLWLWADIEAWLEGSGLSESLTDILETSITGLTIDLSPGLRIGDDKRVRSTPSGQEVRRELQPSRELRAYSAIKAGATYLGLSEALKEFRWGTNEIAWSPWGPPVNSVHETMSLVDDTDFMELANLVESSSESDCDYDVSLFIHSMLLPTLIAYPGTPDWLLARIAGFQTQHRLMSECALVPEDIRAGVRLSVLPLEGVSQEVFSIPGSLLGPAATQASQPIATDDPLITKINEIEEVIHSKAVLSLESTVSEFLKILINTPLWVMALNIRDGWIGGLAAQVTEAFGEDLDEFNTSLAGLDEWLSTPNVLENITEFRVAVFDAWLGPQGAAN